MSENNNQKLFLEPLHLKEGAKMVEFASYMMPIMYANGIIHEHLHTRNKASLFDVSHMCQIDLQGSDVFDFLDTILPIPSAKMRIGKARYTVMLNEQAGIVDDLIINRKNDDLFALVLNASRKEKDLEHIQKYASSFSDLSITVLTENILCAVQGPLAESVLEGVFASSDINSLSFMEGKSIVYKGQSIWINRGGYTGEDGFELSVPNQIANDLVETMLKHEDLELAGLGARNSLRLEAGLSLYGNDMDETTNVYEADLAFAVSKLRLENKSGGIEFVGRSAMLEIDRENLSKKRIAILPDGKAPLREHVKLYEQEFVEDEENDCIGEICSGVFSPSLNQPIAFAYVSASHIEIGKKLWANLRGKMQAVEIVALPFVAHKYKK